MNIQIFYSSLTGNTEKVASHLKETLLAEGHIVTYKNTRETLRERSQEGDSPLPFADLILICFWCRRSSMDSDSLKLLSMYRNQPIAAVGTIGGNIKGAYGDRVRNTVAEAVSEHNRCQGVFICQGKIAESRTEARRNLPKTSPHYLDDEAYARHLATRTHPDEADLSDAAAFVSNLVHFCLLFT